jgi:UDP-N-acetylmuramate dehydrogenase
VAQRVPLGPYTTLKVGGKADWFIRVDRTEELRTLLPLLGDRHIPWHVLGKGSNVLVSDHGVRGVVLCLASSKEPLEVKHLKNGRILLELAAGMPLPHLVQWGIKNEVQGLEFLAGIPGSLGGAWAMNAGSHGKEIKDLTTSLQTVSPEGQMARRGKRQLCFGYRFLRLEAGTIILSGALSLSAGDGAGIRREARRLWTQRRARQPLGQPSCGSVFKNPPGDFAGRLIEKAGLKGVNKRGAQISSLHANFIINRGDAKASDVLYLMNLIRSRVRAQFGVLLEPEVHLWGCSLKEMD